MQNNVQKSFRFWRLGFRHCIHSLRCTRGFTDVWKRHNIIRLLARCFANNYIQIGMSLLPRLMFLIIITLLCLIRPESRLRPAIHDKAKILQMLLSLWKSMFLFLLFHQLWLSPSTPPLSELNGKCWFNSDVKRVTRCSFSCEMIKIKRLSIQSKKDYTVPIRLS